MKGGYASLNELTDPYPINNNISSNNYDRKNLVVKDSIELNNNTFTQELGLIFVGALVFVISFLWKDFISDFQHVFLSDHPGILGRFLYTLLVSLIAVQIIVFLRNYLKLSRHSFLTTFNTYGSIDTTGSDS